MAAIHSNRVFALFLVLSSLCSPARAQSNIPHWTAYLDPLKPHGGVPLAENTTYFNLYHAVPEIGTYNMSPMFDFHDGQFLACWKNSPQDEDQPGQRILYSQSLDGVTWTPTDGTNILFPNVSTSSNPAALFAEPILHINGRFYAAASPHQFCLYPVQDQVPGLGQESLLLRQIITPGIGKFGPIFWATGTIPAGFEEASAALGIVTVDQMDETTQGDIATLSNFDELPCGPTSAGSLKCEACLNGCESPANMVNLTQEHTHYVVPGGDADVILYRISFHRFHSKLNLGASVRYGNGSWSEPVVTSIPDDHANLNAGPLPDGRIYLLSNAMPAVNRDPLFLSTTADGWNWSNTTALTTCELDMYKSDGQPWGCMYRYQGGSKQGGCQYPQGMSIVEPASVAGFWAIYSVNKEDMWIVRVPFSSIV